MALLHCAYPGTGSPKPVCGNEKVETGEHCEAMNDAAGIYGCRAGVACGNGQLDPDEECDDGNNRSGDGCSSDCFTEGACGDGRVDPAEECDGSDLDHGVDCDGECRLVRACGDGFLDPGETCDDSNTEPGDGCDGGCETELGGPECGNGIVEAGEQCDDGNHERHDDCYRCRWVQTVYVTDLWVEEPGVGYDFVGENGSPGQWDCRVDNKLAEIDEYRHAFTAAFAYSIDSGYALLISLDFLEDPRGGDDAELTAYFYSGEDADSDVRTSRRGGDLYYVREEGLRPDRSPATVLTGSVRGGYLDIGTEEMTLHVTAGPFVVPFGMARVRMVGTVVTDGRRVVGLTQGHFVAAVTARSIAEFHESYTEYFTVLTNLDPSRYGSFLAALVYGNLELGGTGLYQPDVDLDGDGLERFYDTRPEDDVVNIDLCVDGDGTEIRGEQCVADPRIQDGYSFTYGVQAVWVRLIGTTAN